jgi:signal transduction histidine kinase
MPRWRAFLAGVGLLLVAGMADWLSGPELASAVFYLPAILWMTWRGGRWPGLGMAVASGTTWLGLVLAAHPPFEHPFVPYWNALVRTTTFTLVSILTAEVLGRRRAERGQQRAYDDLQRQAAILQSILNSMGDGVVVAGANGKLLHVNPMARRLLRIPEPEADFAKWLSSQNLSLSAGVNGETSPRNPLLLALRGESVDDAEMFLPYQDGEEGVWLSVTSRPLRDQTGRIAGGVSVFADVTARKTLERQIAEASDREQRRLGEDLHDGLCQHLVSTAFAARGLAARLTDRKLPEAEDATEIAELLGAAISQARDVARGLCLVPLEAGGLASALEELTTNVRSHYRISCRFVEQDSIPALEPTLGTSLFRIAQEAVSNAVKHGRAGQITVTLSGDAEQIRLEVEDDGAGFQTGEMSARGMGLHIMNYRARMLGAALDIEPRPGRGTRVTCIVRRSDTKQLSVYAHD